MKREICAVLLLAILIGGSIWNIRRAESLTAEIKEHLALSEKALFADDPDYAEEQLEAALRIWMAARGYTQVFLRHQELDSISDAFYDTLEALHSEEIPALPAVYGRLRYHLDCVTAMEHVRWGSVF